MTLLTRLGFWGILPSTSVRAMWGQHSSSKIKETPDSVSDFAASPCSHGADRSGSEFRQSEKTSPEMSGLNF